MERQRSIIHRDGRETLWKGTISLYPMQWNTILEQMIKMGPRNKVPRHEKLLGPIVIVASANYREKTRTDPIGYDTYEAAFPFPLHVYRDRFKSETMNLAKVTVDPTTFKCKQCSVDDPVLYKDNVRRMALNAYDDTVRAFENTARLPMQSERGVLKFETRAGFKEKWQLALSLLHSFISYNPFYSTKKEAYDAFIEFYKEFSYAEMDENGKYIRDKDGKMVRAALRPSEMKDRMRLQGVTIWLTHNMETVRKTCLSISIPPTLKQDERGSEAKALGIFKAFLQYFDSHSPEHLPKLKESKNYIAGIKSYLKDRRTARDTRRSFGWVKDLELSSAMKEREEELEAKAAEEEELWKQKVDAVMKRIAAIRIWAFLKKMRSQQEEKLELERFEAKLAIVKKRIAAIRLWEFLKKVDSQRQLALKEMTQNQKRWFESTWNTPLEKPSRHLVVREKQLKEAEVWLGEKLSERVRVAERELCEDETARKQYESFVKRPKTPYFPQPTKRLCKLARDHARDQAAFMFSNEYGDNFDKWNVHFKDERLNEIKRRDTTKSDEPFQTLWELWDDEKPTGKRSFYIENPADHYVKQKAKLNEMLPKNPKEKPKAEWVKNMLELYFGIRVLVEHAHKTGIYTAPTYVSLDRALAGFAVPPIVQDVGVKFCFFHAGWDEEECKDSLITWMTPGLIPTFHIYIASFLELVSQWDPKIKLFIWRYVCNAGFSLRLDDKSLPRMKPAEKMPYRQSAVLWVSRELYDQCAASQLYIERPTIRRHAVPEMSEMTKTKELKQLEAESADWVKSTPSTYFKFRHDQMSTSEAWKFDAEEWLKPKDMPESGFRDGVKGQRKRSLEQDEDSKKEAECKAATIQATVVELRELFTKRRRLAPIAE